MLSIEQIREALKDRNLYQVSRSSGISYSTLHRINKGDVGKVRYEFIMKLSDYIEKTTFPKRIKKTFIAEKKS